MPAKRHPKIVKFKPAQQLDQKSAISTLQEALRQARKGDVSAVAIAVVRPSGSINCSRSESHDVARLLGAISLLHYRTLVATEND